MRCVHSVSSSHANVMDQVTVQTCLIGAFQPPPRSTCSKLLAHTLPKHGISSAWVCVQDGRSTDSSSSSCSDDGLPTTTSKQLPACVPRLQLLTPLALPAKVRLNDRASRTSWACGICMRAQAHACMRMNFACIHERTCTLLCACMHLRACWHVCCHASRLQAMHGNAALFHCVRKPLISHA